MVRWARQACEQLARKAAQKGRRRVSLGVLRERRRALQVSVCDVPLLQHLGHILAILKSL